MIEYLSYEGPLFKKRLSGAFILPPITAEEFEHILLPNMNAFRRGQLVSDGVSGSPREVWKGS